MYKPEAPTSTPECYTVWQPPTVPFSSSISLPTPPWIPFLSSRRQPSANWPSKAHQGEPATEVKFISCHLLSLNAARGSYYRHWKRPPEKKRPKKKIVLLVLFHCCVTLGSSLKSRAFTGITVHYKGPKYPALLAEAKAENQLLQEHLYLIRHLYLQMKDFNWKS